MNVAGKQTTCKILFLCQIQSLLKFRTHKACFVICRHGNGKVFSCRGIEICINYFKSIGHTRITAFVPKSRTYFPRPDHPIRDQHILEKLRIQGVLTYTPARRVNWRTIVCYDDRYLLAH